MQFTGERFLPTLRGDIRLEHFHRYEWCQPLVAGRRVLDIASGEGYGSAILARSAAQVTGVDISVEAVEHARGAYAGQGNLAFLQGDAACMPLPDASVDVVVSFETIEHHDRHEEMMAEVRRVLVPQGVLVLSSPNKKIYSDLAGGDHNHYHVKELYFDELDELLRRHFSSVGYFGQRFTATSLVQPLPPDAVAGREGLAVYTETAQGVVRANPRHIEPMYYLAVASNGPLPPLPGASAFFSELDNPFHDQQRETVRLGTEIQRMSAYIAEVDAVVHRRDADLRACEALVMERDAALRDAGVALAALQSDLDGHRSQLEAIVNSRSWRLVSRLRRLLGRP